MRLTNSLKSLRDDKDVVNANPEEDEGNDGVCRGVEEAKHGAEAVAQDHPHGHTGTRV